jgi:hypothetical protein
VREVVIGALGELLGTAAFIQILPNLTDPDPAIQRATLHSLRKLADLRAIRPLLAVAMGRSTLRHLALDVVVKFGIVAVPELLTLVREKELGFAHLSIVALGRIGHVDAFALSESGKQLALGNRDDIPRTGQNETFNRYANGVRAHADGVGVKQPNLTLMAVRGIAKSS